MLELKKISGVIFMQISIQNNGSGTETSGDESAILSGGYWKPWNYSLMAASFGYG